MYVYICISMCVCVYCWNLCMHACMWILLGCVLRWWYYTHVGDKRSLVSVAHTHTVLPDHCTLLPIGLLHTHTHITRNYTKAHTHNQLLFCTYFCSFQKQNPTDNALFLFCCWWLWNIILSLWSSTMPCKYRPCLHHSVNFLAEVYCVSVMHNTMLSLQTECT